MDENFGNFQFENFNMLFFFLTNTTHAFILFFLPYNSLKNFLSQISTIYLFFLSMVNYGTLNYFVYIMLLQLNSSK